MYYYKQMQVESCFTYYNDINTAGDIDVTQDNAATDESALPDIYVEEDLKRIAAKNKEIDDDLDVIGEGVTKLKEIALDINNELDKQDETLQKIDKKADIALDHVDNINVSMKKALDGVIFILINDLHK